MNDICNNFRIIFEVSCAIRTLGNNFKKEILPKLKLKIYHFDFALSILLVYFLKTIIGKTMTHTGTYKYIYRFMFSPTP